MTYRPAPVPPGAPPVPAIPARLEPDAIGVTQDTVIGLASSAPAATVGLTLAATAAYGGGPVIVLCAVPMVVIANAYRRLNLWNANCGASFEWVGRAINPYLGFLTGWLMIAAYITGAVTGVVVLAPSVLAVTGANTTSTGANIAISTAVLLVMLVIAVAGIKLTARVQVTMAIAEYTILVGFAVAGLAWVLGHHPGTVPVTRGWFSLTGVNGKGDLAAGLVASVYIFSGWDGTFYVNEEVKHRRVNPGRAAVIAVGILTVLYTLSQVGLQGVVSPARLQANAPAALVYVAGAMGGGAAAKVMALSLALSVIAATGTSIVLPARIVYGMAGRRVLPPFLGNVSGRFSTPVAASLVVGAVITGPTIVYLLATSLQSAFNDVVNLSGQMFAVFYILTALAAVAYYRHRISSNVWDAILVGLLPLGGAAFLGWILYRYLQTAAAPQLWSFTGVIVAGLIMMAIARFGLRSPFFQTPRESWGQQ